MLLAVGLVFLFLTLPNSIYFVLDITYGFNKPPVNNDYYQWLRYRRLTILTVIMFQLSDLQHATNFFLYLLTSDKFRRSLITICVSTIHILSTLLTCWYQRKRDSKQISNTRFDKSHQGISFHSSVSDMSNIMQNPRYKKSRPPPFCHYHSLRSKSTTTIET
jgi:hypothetical protein